MLIFVYGGSGSGKSEYAERLVTESSAPERYYVATMEPYGAEGEKRIKRHQALRAGKGFITVEQPVCLETLRLPEHAAVLIEDLSNLLANEIWSAQGRGAAGDPAALICDAVCALAACCERVVVVGNDIFRDSVGGDEELAVYVRLLAECHRRLAAAADRVVEVVCGLAIVQKEGSEEDENGLS